MAVSCIGTVLGVCGAVVGVHVTSQEARTSPPQPITHQGILIHIQDRVNCDFVIPAYPHMPILLGTGTMGAT
jgi:hypothetical protein